MDAVCGVGIASGANRRFELVLGAIKENFYSSLWAIAAAIRAGYLRLENALGGGANVIGGKEIDIFSGLPYGFGKINFSRN